MAFYPVVLSLSVKQDAPDHGSGHHHAGGDLHLAVVRIDLVLQGTPVIVDGLGVERLSVTIFERE